MAMSRRETEELLNAALQMSRPELERFVARLFALKAKEETPSLTSRESELLHDINQSVHEALHLRYEALVRRRRHHRLTRTEHAELLALTKQLEEFDVQRLKWLSELAQLRGVSLKHLMHDLGIKAPEPEYA